MLKLYFIVTSGGIELILGTFIRIRIESECWSGSVLKTNAVRQNCKYLTLLFHPLS